MCANLQTTNLESHDDEDDGDDYLRNDDVRQSSNNQLAPRPF